MRKNEKLLELLGKIDEEWVEEAAGEKKPGKRKWKWGAAAAGIAAAAAAAVLLWPGKIAPLSSMEPVQALAEAADPVQGNKQAEIGREFQEQIGQFSDRMAAEILRGAGNQVCSPASLYVALSMLAECAGGESRDQLLRLLGTEDMDVLREQAGNLWESLYLVGETDRMSLSDSVWLNQDISFHQELTERLAEDYYADSFRGEMGTEAMNEKLQSWLNEKTGNLLEEQAEGLEMQEDTAMALISAVYLNGRWQETFDAENTRPGEFTLADGSSVTADFMNQFYSGKSCVLEEQYQAAALDFEEAGRMILMLPAEGIAPEDLLADPQAMKTLRGDWENEEYRRIQLSLPKFDAVSSAEIKETLKELGVTDIFDENKADMSPLSDSDIVVSRITHAARVKVDEEGCEAAAYTAVITAGSAAGSLDEIVEMKLDRPFLFSVVSRENVPLFIGVVQRPAEN